MTQDPVKPKKMFVDKKLRQHSGLLDSLLTIIGAEPDSIVHRKLLQDSPKGLITGRYDRPSNTVTVSPDSEDPRRTIMHELGHMFAFEKPRVALEFADSTSRDLREQEPFADAFADLFQAGNDTTRTSNQDAKLLFRLIGRMQQNVQK
jgi:hypothetical protein